MRLSFTRTLPVAFISVLIAVGPRSMTADEGMFPISEIGQVDLAGSGLNMAVDDIFNSEEVCLVDGICRVNGCTGSFVSPNGLIITNHHCAYRAIQSSSTEQQDYLKDGFMQKRLPKRYRQKVMWFGSPSPSAMFPIRS